MKRMCVALVCVFALSSCMSDSSFSTEAPPDQLSQAMKFETSESAANVYFYRPAIGSYDGINSPIILHTPGVDYICILLGPAKFVEFNLPSGDYSVSVPEQEGRGVITGVEHVVSASKETSITLEAGKNYYFHVGVEPILGVFHYWILAEKTEAEARHDMQGFQMVAIELTHAVDPTTTKSLFK